MATILILSFIFILVLILSLVITFAIKKDWFAIVRTWFGTSLQKQTKCTTTDDKETLLKIIKGDAKCPVDCQGSWSDWSTCINGTQTRTYSVTTPASNGGLLCPISPQTQTCTSSGGTGTSVDCQGSWSDWSTCTNGTQTRTYSVTTPASNGGLLCPISPQTQTCTSSGGGTTSETTQINCTPLCMILTDKTFTHSSGAKLIFQSETSCIKYETSGTFTSFLLTNKTTNSFSIGQNTYVYYVTNGIEKLRDQFNTVYTGPVFNLSCTSQCPTIPTQNDDNVNCVPLCIKLSGKGFTFSDSSASVFITYRFISENRVVISTNLNIYGNEFDVQWTGNNKFTIGDKEFEYRIKEGSECIIDKEMIHYWGLIYRGSCTDTCTVTERSSSLNGKKFVNESREFSLHFSQDGTTVDLYENQYNIATNTYTYLSTLTQTDDVEYLEDPPIIEIFGVYLQIRDNGEKLVDDGNSLIYNLYDTTRTCIPRCINIFNKVFRRTVPSVITIRFVQIDGLNKVQYTRYGETYIFDYTKTANLFYINYGIVPYEYKIENGNEILKHESLGTFTHDFYFGSCNTIC